MQRLFVWTLAASTLFFPALSAQFSEFAVTDDGRLYFTTELRTGAEDGRSKVYRVTSEGLSLHATGGDFSNAIAGPFVFSALASGDGSITGYARHIPCGGSCMIYTPRTTYHLQGAGFPSIVASSLQISRNGRFLLTSVFDAPTLRFELPTLIELPSQTRRPMPQFGRAASPRQAIANDGSIVFHPGAQTKPLIFAPLDAPARDIAGTGGAFSAILSPNGNLIAYERETPTHRELVLTDPQGSTHRLLATAPPSFAFTPSFANDGTLLYLDADRRPTLLAPGAESRVLFTGPAQTAIISGNAQLVWIATANGQILRVRTIDSVADEIVPETPNMSARFASAYPGSIIRLSGTGISPETIVTVGETRLLPTELRGQTAAYQLPWEYAPSVQQQPLVVRGPNSPFRQEIIFTLVPEPTISFETAESGSVLQAAHRDFRGVLTKEDPARPGETIHVFASNMGPVDRPVATGEPSPSDPPARITSPFGCYLFPYIGEHEVGPAVGLAVPFAGLSGGLIGVYQLDVTIPDNWTTARSLLQCRMEDGTNHFRGSSADIDIAVSPR